MVQIAPSILSADFSCLGKEICHITQAGADLIHIDVMDGHFVPNLTIGPMVVSSVRKYSTLPFDVHLMIEKPSLFIDDFIEAGADFITIHVESDENPADLIAKIKKHGKKAGLSIRPKTNISQLIPYLPDIDLILVMAVEPGFGGQAFQLHTLDRLSEIKSLICRKKIMISVDGGINLKTAPACVLAGADILVSGSYIFKHRSYAQAINQLKKEIPYDKNFNR